MSSSLPFSSAPAGKKPAATKYDYNLKLTPKVGMGISDR